MTSSYFSQVRPEMVQFVPDGIREVLDIGCSEGRFGELLQRVRGCRVTGVEPNPHASSAAQTRLHKVYESSAEAFLSSHEGKYDAIFFNDVLEHLSDPWEQLRKCRRLLKSPNGIIIASVPNICYYRALKEILVRRDFPYQNSGIFDRTHLRFFTKNSFLRMFDESGYRALRCQGINELASRRIRWMNHITFRFFQDLMFLEFVVVAEPLPNS